MINALHEWQDLGAGILAFFAGLLGFFAAIAIFAASRERYRASEAVPPEQFKPSDDDGGTPDHHVERSKGLLLAVGSRATRSIRKFEVGLNRTEIDLFRHQSQLSRIDNRRVGRSGKLSNGRVGNSRACSAPL